MPSGLASLVLQASAPLTVVIAGVWLRERITRRQAVGIAIAVLALAAIAVHRAQVGALLPVVLLLCGALGWAFGNVAVRKAAAPNPLHLTLWMSVVPPVPMSRPVVRRRRAGADRRRPRRPCSPSTRCRRSWGCSTSCCRVARRLRPVDASARHLPVEHRRAVLDARPRRGRRLRPGCCSPRCPTCSRSSPAVSSSAGCCGRRGRRGWRPGSSGSPGALARRARPDRGAGIVACARSRRRFLLHRWARPRGRQPRCARRSAMMSASAPWSSGYRNS